MSGVPGWLEADEEAGQEAAAGGNSCVERVRDHGVTAGYGGDNDDIGQRDEDGQRTLLR